MIKKGPPPLVPFQRRLLHLISFSYLYREYKTRKEENANGASFFNHQVSLLTEPAKCFVGFSPFLFSNFISSSCCWSWARVTCTHIAGAPPKNNRKRKREDKWLSYVVQTRGHTLHYSPFLQTVCFVCFLLFWHLIVDWATGIGGSVLSGWLSSVGIFFSLLFPPLPAVWVVVQTKALLLILSTRIKASLNGFFIYLDRRRLYTRLGHLRRSLTLLNK